MKYGILFLASVNLVGSFCLAERVISCEQPLPVWIFVLHHQEQLPKAAISPAVTESAKTGAAVSTLLGTITAVGPTQIAQNARVGLTLGILACDDHLPPQKGALDWQDSPTKLALGSDNLQYHIGAVVGNWALFAGIAGIWGAVAYQIGPSAAHFPGSLVLPTLFLISPTAASTVTLIRQGNAAQQAVGSCFLILTLLGSSAAGAPLLPQFFKATWEPKDSGWIDAKAGSGWVNQYGELFDTYGPARQGYIIIELLTSVAVGTLKSYQALQDDCGSLLWGAVGVYNAYAISQLALRPSRNPHVQYFFSGVAALQALALTTQAIALATASEETQQQVKSVTQWIVVATEYLMMVKTLFDIGLRFKGLYEEVFVKKPIPKTPTKPILELDVMDSPIDLLPATGEIRLIPPSRSESSVSLDSIPPAATAGLAKSLLQATEEIQPREISILEQFGRRDSPKPLTLEKEIARALSVNLDE